MNKTQSTKPWSWIPSLYFAEGLPYVLVMTVSVIMYKSMGISNTDIALYTSWLYLPWLIKPFWSPLVDVLKSKRWWIVVMQLFIGAGLAGIAFSMSLPNYFQWSLAFFWLLAFGSATQDIAIDGFYMLGLTEKDQALFVGIRSTFYRIAMLFGQGALVFAAGFLDGKTILGHEFTAVDAWQITFIGVGILFGLLALYHTLILPKPILDEDRNESVSFSKVLNDTRVLLLDFFNKDQIGLVIAMIFCYRLGEAQLVKLASPFLLDTKEAGGLGFTTQDIGVIYGTIGTLCLVAGGIIGGVVASKKGLKKVFLPCMISLNLPNVFYIILAYFQISNPTVVSLAVGIEQFGYGFGFTAFMLYLMMISQGKHQTSHFAICTGLMAGGMMIPGMISGWIQEQVGYPLFFVWVMICVVPSFVLYRYVKIDPSYGKK